MKLPSLLLRLSLVALVALVAAASSSLFADSSLKIIKFEADWCGACKQMKPVFSSVSKSVSGVAFQTVDVDRQASVAEKYGVGPIPAIIAVKDGRVVGRLVGTQSESKLRNFVKKHR